MTETLFAAAVLLQASIVAVLLEALRRWDLAAAANALVALAASLLPVIVEFVLRFFVARIVSLGPELPLWIATAGFLHSLGMLGPYDSIWWWDNLTHVVSSSLIAALVYAGFVVVFGQTNGVGSVSLTVAATVAFVFAAGVFWELIELVARDVGERYDIDPVLVHYGWRDTAFDLVFDLMGALVVVVLDIRTFVPIASRSPRVTGVFVLGSAVMVVVGSVLLALLVGFGQRGDDT